MKYKLANGMIVEKIADLPANKLILCKVLKVGGADMLWKPGEQLALVVATPGDWPIGGVLGKQFDVEERIND